MTSLANQRKLDIVEELTQLAEQAGMTLIDMATAFVLNHRAVTSASTRLERERPTVCVSDRGGHGVGIRPSK